MDSPLDLAAGPPHAAPGAGTVRAFDLGRVQRVLRGLCAPTSTAPAMPWLHAEVARRMAERLAWIRLKPARVAHWWALTGASTDILKQVYPDAEHVQVEPTAALRDAAMGWAKPKSAGWSLPWRKAEAPMPIVEAAAVEPASADMLWANMMLHAARDPAKVMAQWHRALAVDGFLMFSCFGPGTATALSAVFSANGWGAAAAPQVDMHDLGDMLVQTGFAEPVMDQETITLTWPTPEALLAELHSLGGNAALDRFSGCRTPRWRARLLAALHDLQQVDGRLALPFEVVYGHAIRPVQKVKMSGEARFSVDELRAMTRGSHKPPSQDL